MGRTRTERQLDGQGDGDPPEDAEGGFTLIELMVVLLILAILMAIAIPTFLGVTGGANDRAAQSNLSNALTEASAIYQGDSQSYATPSTGTIASAFSSSAPEFTWTTGNCSAGTPNCISYDISTDANAIVLAAWSKTNVCWYVLYSPSENATTAFPYTAGTTSPSVSLANAGTFYAKGSPSSGNCTASTGVGTSGATFTYGSSFSQPGSN